MNNKKMIYVVDDERDICDLVAHELRQFGFDCETFSTGAAASAAIQRRLPDLCLIDLGLPDMDGLGLVKQLCQAHRIGVVIVSGRGSLPDRVLGLEVGADDYITKPFDPRELVARINSVLRRLEQVAPADQTAGPRRAHFLDWTYDPATLTLSSSDGRAEVLSSAEAELLTQLLKAPRQVLSRDRLLGELQGRDATPFDRSIDVRMSRIRKKIESDPKNPRIIKTIYGAGYMFAASVEWLAD